MKPDQDLYTCPLGFDFTVQKTSARAWWLAHSSFVLFLFGFFPQKEKKRKKKNGKIIVVSLLFHHHSYLQEKLCDLWLCIETSVTSRVYLLLTSLFFLAVSRLLLSFYLHFLSSIPCLLLFFFFVFLYHHFVLKRKFSWFLGKTGFQSLFNFWMREREV